MWITRMPLSFVGTLIRKSFEYRKAGIWVWFAVAIFIWLINMILNSTLGSFGSVACILINTLFTGGLLLGVAQIKAGAKMKFEYVFWGFRDSLGPLLQLALVMAVLSAAFSYFVLDPFATYASDVLSVKLDGLLNGGDEEMAEMGALAAQVGLVQALASSIVTLACLLLSLPLNALGYLAPALLLFGKQPLPQALKWSFKATCLNWPIYLVLFLIGTSPAAVTPLLSSFGFLQSVSGTAAADNLEAIVTAVTAPLMIGLNLVFLYFLGPLQTTQIYDSYQAYFRNSPKA